MEDLRQKAIAAKESGLYNKLMVITDGVFSMDGDVAKLPEIVEIAEELEFNDIRRRCTRFRLYLVKGQEL